ncbi:MAG: RagB/SusD family nutrient uptake outer membrane protein [Alistipes sp.]|nr:RagB/SusD family nutrient uptake outer membrane protein [Alistipes sp.]
MKRYILIAIMSLCGVFFSSCSLEEEPTYFVDTTNYYKNTTQCRTAVNAVYKRLSGLYSFKFFTITEGHSDIIYDAAPTLPLARLELSPTFPDHAETIWNYCYEMIMYANGVLANVAKAPISEDDRLNLLSETAIMRAFYYYLLTSHFKDVPFYTDEIATQEDLDRIAKLPRMSAVDTRTYLINELQSYYAQLKASDESGKSNYTYLVRTGDTEENRAGVPLLLTLIGKMAMWQAAFDENQTPDYWYQIALDAFKEIEIIYGTFNEASYPLEEIKFRYKNTAESIFEVQHSYTSGGLIYTSNLACACIPSSSGTSAENVLWDGIKVDELSFDMSRGWGKARPNLVFCRDIQPVDGADKRANINMALTYNGESFNQYKNSGTPYLGPKFWCPGMYLSYDSNNYRIFRYGDIILSMAECYYHLGQYTKAHEYLNMTRVRAGLEEVAFKKDKTTFKEIQNERARELFGEFQRKFDLVRWGVWYDWTLGFNSYNELRENIRPCHEYLPIPDKQVVYSGYALDNKEYNKYGM